MDNAGPDSPQPRKNPLEAEPFYEGLIEIVNDIENEFYEIEQMLASVTKKDPEPSSVIDMEIPPAVTDIQEKRREVILATTNLRRKLTALKHKVTL